jgi:hypothetical protein
MSLPRRDRPVPYADGQAVGRTYVTRARCRHDIDAPGYR